MEHDHLIAMLNRLKLTAIRDQLDSLIDEAGRRELTIREALSLFCEREITRKDERRIEMGIGLARFPFVRDLDGFDFAAQPSKADRLALAFCLAERASDVASEYHVYGAGLPVTIILFTRPRDRARLHEIDGSERRPLRTPRRRAAIGEILSERPFWLPSSVDESDIQPIEGTSL
jgi:hypothetical protein